MSISTPPLGNLVLITGGARSGKSTLAEELASKRSSNVIYLATMPRIETDRELENKIESHRMRRPSTWHTKEATLAIEQVVDSLDNTESVCLIDCLSAYISNIMFSFEQSGEDQNEKSDTLKELTESAIVKLTESIKRKGEILFIVVTNEVGWAVVPENKSARVFRELLGTANQSLARSAESMYLCCSGITIRVKSEGRELLR